MIGDHHRNGSREVESHCSSLIPVMGPRGQNTSIRLITRFLKVNFLLELSLCSHHLALGEFVNFLPKFTTKDFWSLSGDCNSEEATSSFKALVPIKNE